MEIAKDRGPLGAVGAGVVTIEPVYKLDAFHNSLVVSRPDVIL